MDIIHYILIFICSSLTVILCGKLLANAIITKIERNRRTKRPIKNVKKNNLKIELSDIHNSIIEKFIKDYTKPIETPYIIGIYGGSGSGKSLVASIIANTIRKMFPPNPNDIVIISQDSYYFGGNSDTNYDIPSAIDFDLLISHTQELVNGNPIDCPIYDFKTHSRKKETITIQPAKVIIMEGILIGTQEKLRSFFDLKIFINSRESTQVFRRLKRDVDERGRTIEDVRERYHKHVAPSYSQYVLPSAQFADMVINNNDGGVYVGLEAVLNHIITVYKNISTNVIV